MSRSRTPAAKLFAPGARDPHPVSVQRCKTILVVDDERDIRESLGDLLREEGYDVIEAQNGVEALARLRENTHVSPCVIVLDLMMPVMDGYQFRAEQLRDSALAGIPVVVVSAEGNVRRKTASMQVATATQLSEQPGAPKHTIKVEDAGFGAIRPSGKRFGTLVHAVLATLPLDASAAEVDELAALHARLFAAPDDERAAAAGIATRLLRHPRIAAARAAEAAGRRVWRETPVSLRLGDDANGSPQIVDGQVDLAYETEQGWVIVDFKTDIEIVSAQDAYKQQVALYVEAVQRATGQSATGVLLRV